MRFRKGLLVGLICMLIALIGAIGLVGCNPDKDDEDVGTVEPGPDTPDNPDEPDNPDIPDIPDVPDIPDKPGTDVGNEEACEHTYGSWAVSLPATCTSEGESRRRCSKCGNVETDVIVRLQHKFTSYTSDGNATCITDGTKTAVCENKGCTQTQTVADANSKTGHRLEVTETLAATCVSHGKEVKECKNTGCTYTEEKQVIAKGHVWSIAAPTCTEGVECTVEGCTASKPALGHSYQVESVPKSCTVDGMDIHSCSRCGDSYKVITEHASGHEVREWLSGEERPVKACEYELTYSGYCDACGEPQYKSETVTRHILVKRITKTATCVAEGEITTSCDGCQAEALRVVASYSNEGAHSWGEVTEADGKATRSCMHEGCDKKLIVYTTAVADVKKEELSNALEINNATIAPDEGVINGLSAESIKLTAEIIENSLPEGINGGPVYDFTLEADGEYVTDFGGYITITLPYERLKEGEDPENIGISYINDYGEIEQYIATYSDGFVSFKTNHFSKYTVTRLSPAQRCELYGHSNKTTVVEASCTVDGYTIIVCQRCALTERVEGERASGHRLASETVKAADCTQDGSVIHFCENEGCGYEYTQRLPATGHEWVEAEGSVAATCASAGHSSYSCKSCKAEYTLTTAQLQHRYTRTVLAATCTEGGHTTFECSYCEYSYVGDYTAAKGHTYTESVVAPTCTEKGHTLHTCADCGESYKTDELPASHSWDIAKPTCGKGQTCLVCGEKGAKATGAHTMADGVCSVCGTGCEHTNKVTVYSSSCTERGYTLRKCTKCGREERSDYKNALGHDGTVSCIRCGKQLLGEQFFANTVSSVLNKEFAFRLTDVIILTDGYGYSIDFAELFVTYDENNEIYGYGSGTLYGVDESMPIQMRAAVTAVISGGSIYVKIGITNNSGQFNRDEDYTYTSIIENMQYMVIPFGKVSFNGANPDLWYKLIPVAYDVLQTEIIPLVNTLLELNGEDVSELIGRIFESFCTIEKTPSGYTLTLNNEALKTLNDNLYKYTIAENIDLLLGEGTFEELRGYALRLADTTIEQIIVTAMQKGLTTDELLALADEISITLTGCSFGQLIGYETENIKELLKDEQFLATTVLDLVNTYLRSQGAEITVTKAMLEEYIDEYSSRNPYDLLVLRLGGNKAEIKQTIDMYLDSVMGTADLKLYTDIYGNVTGGLIDVSESELDIDGTHIVFEGTVGITDKVSSNINYSAVVEEVREISGDFELTVPAVKMLYPEAKVETYGDGTVKSISGNVEISRDVYEYNDGSEPEYDENGELIGWIEYIRRETRIRVKEYSYEFGENPQMTVYSDCGSWYSVQFNAEGYCREREILNVERLRNGEVIENREEIFDYGSYAGFVAYYYNILTGRMLPTQNGYAGEEIMHNFREDKNKFLGCGDGCLEYGERHYYCIDCGKTVVEYYALRHRTAEKYEPVNGSKIEDCTDGYYAIVYCTECGEELNRYLLHSHDVNIEREVVDLSAYEACEHHRFFIRSCACGKESYIEFDRLPVYLDEGEDALGNKYMLYGCHSCALTVKEEVTYVRDLEHCKEIEATVYTFAYDGRTIGTYEHVNERYSHSYNENKVELVEGAHSCLDGVIVSKSCSVCGEVEDTYTAYEHVAGTRQVIDLSEYGAVCGEKLYIIGCACGETNGMWGKIYYSVMGVSVQLKSETLYNNTELRIDDDGAKYTYYDSLKIFKCPVTDPVRCGLTIGERYGMSASGCEAYLTILLGCDDNGENESDKIELLIQTKHCYIDGGPVQLGGCKYKSVHTCKRCGDSYEQEYISHTVGEKPVLIEGCRYGYRCSVCGEYIDTYYVHETEWVKHDNCLWRLTCKRCGSVEGIEYRHNRREVEGENCLWEDKCIDCGTVFDSVYRHSWIVDLAPACTQYGERHCSECSLSEILSPVNHNWIYEGDLYHCGSCDITNINGISGDVVLENFTESLGGGEKYVVGFWLDYYDKANQHRYEGEYLLNVSLMLTDVADGEDDQVVTDIKVTFNSHGGGNYVEFSKADVEAWAAANGYAAGSYEVRLSFVPRGWQSHLDYAISFD